MLRWLATLAILALLALDVALPRLPIAARGSEAKVREEVEGAAALLGARLPDLALQDLDGQPLDLADFRGHPLLVTFERSVDW